MRAYAGLVDGNLSRLICCCTEFRFGQHAAVEFTLRGAAVKGDALNTRMRFEQGRKVVDANAAGANVRVHATRAFAGGNDIPKRDPVGLQRRNATCIVAIYWDRQQFAQNRPEGIAAVAIVLV